MGIKNLNAFLKKWTPQAWGKISLEQLSGTRVAMDMHNWMYTHYFVARKNVIQWTDVVREDPDEDRILEEWIRALIEFLSRWAEFQITPVLVFDGKAPMEKSRTRQKRQNADQKAWETLCDLKDDLRSRDPWTISSEQIQDLRNKMAGIRVLPSEHVTILRETLEALGFPPVQARWEGEQLCSMLAREGTVSAVFSTDTDNLAYGAPLLLTRFTEPEYNVRGEKIPCCECVWYINILKELDWTRDTWVDLCILAGCDYNENMKGVGVMKAYAYLQTYGSIDHFPPEKFDPSVLRVEACRKLFSPRPVTELWEEGPFFRTDFSPSSTMEPLKKWGCSKEIFQIFSTFWKRGESRVKKSRISPPPVYRMLFSKKVILRVPRSGQIPE